MTLAERITRFEAGFCTVKSCKCMDKAKIRFQKNGKWALLCDRHFTLMCDGKLKMEEALV